MKSGQDTKVSHPIKCGDSFRFICANPSTRILLMFLILVSLNIVACYDFILARLLKLLRKS